MASCPVAGRNTSPRGSGDAAAPFVHHRQVRWADADPAAIAYTARLPEMCLEAIEAWCRDRLGHGWYEMNRDLGIGTPFVHLSLDFRSPVTPRDALTLTVLLHRTGGSSLHLGVVARLADAGRVAFEGRFVCAFVRAGAMKAIPIPARFRAALAREVAIAANQAPVTSPAARGRRRAQSA
ncbi:MAG TPA: thioesterase family protein [Acetobacteraceae bacterium]|nr:thioesterase family protein [Acetobacteraceae bacterium]